MGGPLGRAARKRFAGLRSRWTMPSACASAMASHACEHVVDRLARRGAGRASRRRARGRRPRGTPSPCTARPSRACRRRSRARRARSGSAPRRAPRGRSAPTASACRATSGRRNLSATCWSSWTCVRRDDDAHPALAEDALDAVLAGDDVPRRDRGGSLRHARGPPCGRVDIEGMIHFAQRASQASGRRRGVRRGGRHDRSPEVPHRDREGAEAASWLHGLSVDTSFRGMRACR